jgi:hypothetical protein
MPLYKRVTSFVILGNIQLLSEPDPRSNININAEEQISVIIVYLLPLLRGGE